MPRRKSADLGFSVALGAFLSRARLERALRGLLEMVNCLGRITLNEGDLHLAQHLELRLCGCEDVQVRLSCWMRSQNFAIAKVYSGAMGCGRNR